MAIFNFFGNGKKNNEPPIPIEDETDAALAKLVADTEAHDLGVSAEDAKAVDLDATPSPEEEAANADAKDQDMAGAPEDGVLTVDAVLGNKKLHPEVTKAVNAPAAPVEEKNETEVEISAPNDSVLKVDDGEDEVDDDIKEGSEDANDNGVPDTEETGIDGYRVLNAEDDAEDKDTAVKVDEAAPSEDAAARESTEETPTTSPAGTQEAMSAEAPIETDSNSLFAGKEPANVLHFFEEICGIPHGSGNTKAISDYLVNFANERGLKVRQDKLNNVVIRKDAAPGYEAAEPLLLEGHMDMVCEKNPGVTLDMAKEAIHLMLDADGETIHADGTTLGADDGIGVAIMLGLLDEKDLPAPALECVFTVDEETGMDGAQGIDVSDLKAHRMLNLDSEDEGVFTAGCAGGSHVDVLFQSDKYFDRKEKRGYVAEVSVRGCRGGHSGEMIQEGRAHANQVLGRLLLRVLGLAEFNLVKITGGTKDNAITREAAAELVLPDEIDRGAVNRLVTELDAAVKKEYELTDPDITVGILWKETRSALAMKKKVSANVARFLATAPYGVQEYSAAVKGQPQTSLNMGVLRTTDRGVEMSFLIRSSINTQRDMLTERVVSIAETLKATAQVASSYPAWEFVQNSAFRDTMCRVYKEQTGRDPQIAIIHGGVECGLFAGKIPDLDAVSIGPDTHDIHTPNEHIGIGTIGRTYDFVKELLKNLK